MYKYELRQEDRDWVSQYCTGYAFDHGPDCYLQDDLNFAADYGMELLEYVTQYQGSLMPFKPTAYTPEAIEFIAQTIYMGHVIWCYTKEFLEVEYDADLYRYGFLMVMDAYANPQYHSAEEVDVQGVKIRQMYDVAVKRVILQVGKQLGEETPEETKSQLVKANAEKDAKTLADRILMDTNANLLMEFFNLFQEIGTFHRDVNKYTTEEDVVRHNRMMDLYGQMLCNVTDEDVQAASESGD